jgi:hypothetical protein
MAIQTDFFTWIGFSNWIDTERAFQIGGIVKRVHKKGCL